MEEFSCFLTDIMVRHKVVSDSTMVKVASLYLRQRHISAADPLSSLPTDATTCLLNSRYSSHRRDEDDQLSMSCSPQFHTDKRQCDRKLFAIRYVALAGDTIILHPSCHL